MSTTSRLFVELPNDKKNGYSIKAKELPLPIGGTIGCTPLKSISPSRVLKVKPIPNSNFISIYVHWDGSTIDSVLNKFFKTIEQALVLCALGDCSYIEKNCVAPYFLRTDFRVKRNITFSEKVENIGENCSYLFKNGKWKKIKF